MSSRHAVHLLRCFLGLVFFSSSVAVDVAAQSVLERAHAHNDYEHDRPLFDALDRGFRSIEADIHLVDGELLVAHDLEETQIGRTLSSLYLNPLRERISANGGSVYGEGTPVLLLVDVKSDPDPTYQVLHSVLREYADILALHAADAVVEGAVHVVISGNRARDAMREAAIRFSAYDGRLHDLDADSDPTFVPLISAPWNAVSDWRGDGQIPEADRVRLRDIVARAHEQGRQVRFWGTADTVSVWSVLHAEGVDLIGTDDLEGLSTFLRRP